jgi:hypothetical protein
LFFSPHSLTTVLCLFLFRWLAPFTKFVVSHPGEVLKGLLPNV